MKDQKVLVVVQHDLSINQVVDLEGYGVVSYLKDIDIDLFNGLCQCPGDVHALYELAERLCKVIVDGNFVFVLGPIGSPAFNAIFLKRFYAVCEKASLLFSHSVRESIEEVVNGSTIKKSVFKHVDFIRVN